MMGTADEIIKAPEKGPVFMEDLPEEEQAANLVMFMIPTHYQKKRSGLFD